MTCHPEFSARAKLCRQLARREPDSRDLWLAEAQRWSRLVQKPGETIAACQHEPAWGSNAMTWRRRPDSGPCHRSNMLE